MSLPTLSVNSFPPTDASYSGTYYSIIAQGGYDISQGLPTINLASQTPIATYDLTNAVKVRYDVRTFNTKLGIRKDASNVSIIDSSFNAVADRFPNDTITISAAEFVSGVNASQVISVGTYSSLYSDFNLYVNTYFGYAGGFSSLFASVNNYNYNNSVFDASAFINIITGKSIDASGESVSNLAGSITILNVNNLLRYAVDANVFGNRNPNTGNTASDPSNNRDYGMIDGFLAGDIIYIPEGTTVTLSLAITSENFNPINNIGPNNTNQISNYSQKYGSSYYTEATVASLTGITRTLKAPLVFILSNLS
jgi:hypothetical protein